MDYAGNEPKDMFDAQKQKSDRLAFELHQKSVGIWNLDEIWESQKCKFIRRGKGKGGNTEKCQKRSERRFMNTVDFDGWDYGRN
jgi:hypothetical protein